MKYAPRKVYIKESGGYVELSYTDFCRRRQADKGYMDKLFIPVQGCLLEVVREQYADFYRDRERWRYLQKLDARNSLLSLDGFTDSEGNPLDFIADEAADIAETVVNAVMVDRLKAALKSGTLDLPQKYEAARSRFESIISSADRKPTIRDASKDVVVKLNKRVMVSPEFTALWDRIKQKTAYRVHIDTDTLIENCVKALQNMPVIQKARLISQTADINIDNAGVSHTEREFRTTDIADSYRELPDIITAISDAALLTPLTVKEILVKSGRMKDFLNNPQAFLEKTTEIIRDKRHELAIDGISYIKLDGQEYFAQQIFDTEELIANLDRNAVKVDHSVYDYIVYDSSTVERPFAVALDNDPDVKMFFKIPSKFKIETPIGNYNPDWAVFLNKNGEEKLYFVVETKGSLNPFDRRGKENLKIHCGKQHFKALDNDISLEEAVTWKELRARL